MKIHKGKFIATLLIGVLMLYVHFNYFLIQSSKESFLWSLLKITHEINDGATFSGWNKHHAALGLHIDESKNIKPDAGILRRCFMVIVIPSMPQSEEYRHYLRTRWLNISSWGSHEFEGVDEQYLDFKLMFIIGKEREGVYSEEFIEEMSLHDDIYIIDLVECEKILKHKVLWGMKKSFELFDYEYFIKIDHDTLVDLPHLAKGIQTLPKRNVYTGTCTNVIKRGIYKRSFIYCLGNAYILSRDLIGKIYSLTEQETSITLIPEDGFTGWLVAEVKRKYNISAVLPAKNKKIVDRFGYDLKRGIYNFNRWFYHWLKGVVRMERAFECRIKANSTDCPLMNYYYENMNSTNCICGLSPASYFG
jgi:hypothetical protein